jgi:hypothetical protein
MAASKDGRMGSCVPCNKERKKTYSQKPESRARAAKYSAEHKEQKSAYMKAYRQQPVNKERSKTYRSKCMQKDDVRANIFEATKRWKKEHKNRVAELNRQSTKRQIDKLTDSYVKGRLARGTQLSRSDVPAELVEIKRIQLEIQRKIKEMK